jgi:rhamnogalacturonyl hydrolase YesR
MKLKYLHIIFLGFFNCFLGSLQTIDAQSVKPIATEAIANLAMERGLKEVDLAIYGGTLFMHCMSELAVLQKDPKTLNRTIEIFEKFRTKEIKGRGSFISYEAGGTGVAYLNYLNKTPTLSQHVFEYADKMFKNQKRTSEGLMTAPWLKVDSLDQFMIDCAFAVTPYMLYAGMSMNKPEYVDFAVFQTLEMFKILKDPNGLIHQGRGFVGKGSISEDNWSRGNGWGAFALAFLVRDLPDSHPRKKEVNELAKNFFTAILKYQNQEGLWNQEMTEHTSFVETSGSGLMLFGLGICLEKGIIDKTYLPQFIKGLSGYTSYITPEGDISNVTIGCLCPNKGTKKDYIKHTWKLNDIHAYGPVVLAFTQAMKLGIREITPAKSMGCYVTDFGKPIKPQAFVRYMPEANENICWENDRVAFRVYGPPVKNRVSSGIDIWTKSVDYPIISKWYDQNNQGKSYHENHGEGLDFYHVAYGRGLGGSAIWRNGKPYISAPYATHKILKNTEDEVAFELNFDAWDADGIKVSEKKVISLKKGTNFCKVTSTFTTDSKEPLTIALGLSYTEKPEVLQDAKNGTLTLWEAFLPNNGELGTTIVVKPNQIKEFSAFDKEKYVVLKAKSGKPITYYVGTGWSKSKEAFTKESWLKYVGSEVLKSAF